MEGKRRSSRERLQQAAQTLFAEHGYEATTVAAIIKLAGTSYSQFIAHFGDKSGVMTAILAEGWARINSAIRLATGRTPSPVARLKLALDVVISYLDGDAVFRRLLLTERAGTLTSDTVGQNPGFSEFSRILDLILEDMARREKLAPDIPPQVLRSALVGALEGMLRDQLLVEQSGSRASYSDSAIHLVLSKILSSALSSKATEILLAEEEEDTLPQETPLDRYGDQYWIHHYLDLAAIALGPPGNA
jgi:AcrR family transcriptional regulator